MQPVETLMLLVLDTNTIVSGTLWRGSPHLLMEAAREKRFTPCTCREIMRELLQVLSRPKFTARMASSQSNPRRITKEYRRLALLVLLPATLPQVSRDPEDNVILACGITAAADAIISGDKDLLSLHDYCGIPILTAAQALLNLP